MFAIMHLWARVAILLAAMESISPDVGLDDRMAISTAIAESDATDQEAAWLVAIAWRESSFRSDAVGDHRSSWCWAQVHFPLDRRTKEGWTGESLAADPRRCATVALRVLRTSLSMCRELPEVERLSAYAAGACSSRRGRRISRDRAALRDRAFGGGQ